MREAGNHWHHTDENEGRQEARAQRQHDGNARALGGSLRIGAKCAPSIVGKMHEDVGQGRTRVMRANHRASDRRPARVVEAVRPGGFDRRTQHGEPRNRREHGADVAVERFSYRAQRVRRRRTRRQARGKQVQGSW
jgi:hypothetical protein